MCCTTNDAQGACGAHNTQEKASRCGAKPLLDAVVIEDVSGIPNLPFTLRSSTRTMMADSPGAEVPQGSLEDGGCGPTPAQTTKRQLHAERESDPHTAQRAIAAPRIPVGRAVGNEAGKAPQVSNHPFFPFLAQLKANGQGYSCNTRGQFFTAGSLLPSSGTSSTRLHIPPASNLFARLCPSGWRVSALVDGYAAGPIVISTPRSVTSTALRSGNVRHQCQRWPARVMTMDMRYRPHRHRPARGLADVVASGIPAASPLLVSPTH